MARLRYNGLTTTLAADLASGDTTITFTAALSHAGGVVPTIAAGDTIALSLLDGTGAVAEIVSLTAYTMGATTGTISRAQEGTIAAAHSSGAGIVHSPTAADFATGSSSVLGYAAYNPGTIVDYASTSTTAVDLDATNLAVTFSAPSSGRVLVALTALGNVGGTAAHNWHVREGSTTLGTRYIKTGAGGSSDYSPRAEFVITGLTAGSTHTYKWAQSTSSGGTCHTYAGDTVGPAVMTVTALP